VSELAGIDADAGGGARSRLAKEIMGAPAG
jgi:hypothetical protein